MARLLQEPKEEHLTYLRELIAVTFLRPIVNTHDCKFLGEAIMTSINQRLSVDTVARLFGIKKSASMPSVFTLDTCAKYVGYGSWKDLVTSYNEQNNLYQKMLLFDSIEKNSSFEAIAHQLNDCTKSTTLYETFNQIMLWKASQQDEPFFERLFELHIIFDYQESYKYDVFNTCTLLSILCEKHIWLSQIAITHYANVPYSINYFVEWVVVTERKYYLPLLDRYLYYRANDKEAVLFYHLIVCTYYAENKDKHLFTAHYDILKSLMGFAPELNNMLHMRWYGVQLYHSVLYDNSIMKNNITYQIMHSAYCNHKDSGHRVSSIFMICNYLYFIKDYLLIRDLFEEKINESSTILGYWAELNYNQLKVYYADALYKTGATTMAKQILSEVKKERFDLNFKERMLHVYHELKTALYL